MIKNIIKVKVITETNILKKMIFIAESNNQSLDKQIEQIIKKHIDEYEKENGVIILEIMD